MPDGQLIEEADHKTLRCIELAYRFLGSTIIRILADKTVGADETGNARSRGVSISKVLRDGVRHEEAHPLRKAFVHLQLHGVISGVAGAIRGERVIFLVKVAVLREGSKDLVDGCTKWEISIGQLHACGDGGRALLRWWQRWPSRRQADCVLVQIAGKGSEVRQLRRIRLIWNNVQSWQVRALGPDVRYANDQIGRDLALYV